MSQSSVPVVSGFTQPDLKMYARLAWRWLWLVVLCAVIGGAAAFLVSLNMTPIYQAESKVMINEARTPSAANYNDILASERVARTYADLMKRDSVMAEAFVRLGLDPALVASQITAVTVSPVRDTQLVVLTIEGPNPQLVAAVANTLPSVFVDELRKIQSGRFAESKASLSQQLDEMSRQVETTKLRIGELEQQRTAQEEMEYTQLSSALTQYQTSYANLLQSFEALRLTEAQSTDSVVLMEAAAVPTAPVRPRVLVNTLLAAVVGALAALGIVFLLEYLDDRVQTPEDLQRIAPVPVLGAIGVTPSASRRPSTTHTLRRGTRSGGASLTSATDPVSPDLVPAADTAEDPLISVSDPRHPIVEAYRRLRTNLQYYNLDSTLTSLLLTSAEAGEGKSITSANLAVVMAQSGMRVILVDADLRKPRQHRIFGRAAPARAGRGPSQRLLARPAPAGGGRPQPAPADQRRDRAQSGRGVGFAAHAAALRAAARRGRLHHLRHAAAARRHRRPDRGPPRRRRAAGHQQPENLRRRRAPRPASRWPRSTCRSWVPSSTGCPAPAAPITTTIVITRTTTIVTRPRAAARAKPASRASACKDPANLLEPLPAND